MCLTSIHYTPLYNTNDITVYKVLRLDNCAPYRTDYQYHEGFNYPANTSEKIRRTGRYEYSGDVKQYYEIFGGYLHAYSTKEKALALCKERNGHMKNLSYPFRYKVVKMVIPHDTEYWIGEEDDICATKLYWKKEISIVDTIREFFMKLFN